MITTKGIVHLLQHAVCVAATVLRLWHCGLITELRRHLDALGGAYTGCLAVHGALAERVAAAPRLHLPAIDLHLGRVIVGFV